MTYKHPVAESSSRSFRHVVPQSSVDRLTRVAILLIICSVFVMTVLQSRHLYSGAFIQSISLPLLLSLSNNSSVPLVFQALSVAAPESLSSTSTTTSSSSTDDVLPKLPYPASFASASEFDGYMDEFRSSAFHWLSYLNRSSSSSSLSSSSSSITTRRTACRELDANGQTCVYDGLSCVSLNDSFATLAHHDTALAGKMLRSDDWCKLRHQAADPRYLSSRHWPLLRDTDVPQRSCLSARYGEAGALSRLALGEEGNSSGVKTTKTIWAGRLALVNLDYIENSHNNHLLKDIAWLLDSSLFEDSLHGVLDAGAGSDTDNDQGNEYEGEFGTFSPYQTILLPQTRKQFERQTNRDLNRLTYALVLRKDVTKLYEGYSRSALRTAVQNGTDLRTRPLLEAYPELSTQLLFRPEATGEETNTEHTTVCTARLLIGAKMGDLGHERVCRYMRSRAYDAYGIQRPEVRRLGQIRYPQPSKRLLILDRHVTRRIANAQEVTRQLTERLGKLGVEVSYQSTRTLSTATGIVRTYASGGVVLSPHGSHNMGLIWMQRFSALIEIMPVGYTDYAFNLLAGSCRVWHYELPSSVPHNLSEYYETKCGSKKPHMMSPCTDVKSKDVYVNVDKAFDAVVFAFERLGHDMQSWLSDRI